MSKEPFFVCLKDILKDINLLLVTKNISMGCIYDRKKMMKAFICDINLGGAINSLKNRPTVFNLKAEGAINLSCSRVLQVITLQGSTGKI